MICVFSREKLSLIGGAEALAALYLPAAGRRRERPPPVRSRSAHSRCGR